MDQKYGPISRQNRNDIRRSRNIRNSVGSNRKTIFEVIWTLTQNAGRAMAKKTCSVESTRKKKAWQTKQVVEWRYWEIDDRYYGRKKALARQLNTSRCLDHIQEQAVRISGTSTKRVKVHTLRSIIMQRILDTILRATETHAAPQWNVFFNLHYTNTPKAEFWTSLYWIKLSRNCKENSRWLFLDFLFEYS